MFFAFEKTTKLTASPSSKSKNSVWDERMTIATMQHIPLASAYLCPNCSCIGNYSKECPACASPFLLCLANVLDRAPEEDVQISYERMPSLAA
jgi:hypothetical protein